MVSASNPDKASPRLWLAAAVAVVELALARVRHGRLDLMHLPLGEHGSSPTSGIEGEELGRLLAYLIPRVARRMPWRSDCLVQAMAARHWLARKGAASCLHIGSRKTAERGFEAHAWLTLGDLVVTGWDIDGFEQFAAFPARGDT